jgi:hypothetical protein
MIYQLPTGKIIEISLEQYLEMTDDDIEYFIAYEIGDYIEDPFFGCTFYNKSKNSINTKNDLDIENEKE